MNLVRALLAALCAVCVRAELLPLPLPYPQPHPHPPETLPPPTPFIVSSHRSSGLDGSFQYGYETSDGSVVEAQGEQRAVGPEGEVGTVMRGSYSYLGTDGVTYTVTWTADENGFQAKGDHLLR